MAKKDASNFSLAKLEHISDKTARRAASTDPENLETKRLEFSKQAELLKGMITQIQVNTEKLGKLGAGESDEKERTRLISENERYYSMASLFGLLGLYTGLGLIADMLSIEYEYVDEKGKEIAARESAADIGWYTLQNARKTRKLTVGIFEMLDAFGQKMGFSWEGRFAGVAGRDGKGGGGRDGDDGEEDEEDSEDDGPPEDAAKLDEAAPAGIPKGDLEKARAGVVTPEEVAKTVRGK